MLVCQWHRKASHALNLVSLSGGYMHFNVNVALMFLRH